MGNTSPSLTYRVISVQEDDSAPSHTQAVPVHAGNPIEIIPLNKDGRAETQGKKNQREKLNLF